MVMAKTLSSQARFDVTQVHHARFDDTEFHDMLSRLTLVFGIKLGNGYSTFSGLSSSRMDKISDMGMQMQLLNRMVITNIQTNPE